MRIDISCLNTEENYYETFVTLVTSVTLRATLVPIASFVLITWLANWESTFMTRDKHLATLLHLNLIATNLASLHNTSLPILASDLFMSMQNVQLIPLVRASNQTRLHERNGLMGAVEERNEERWTTRESFLWLVR